MVSTPDSAQGGRKYTDDGVGAANAGFAGAYHQLQNQTGEGGFHPDGEKAARQVDVPKRDFDGRNIPKSAATVLEAEATPDSAVDVIQEAIAKGEFSFDTITDEAALKRARTTVEEKGWDGAMEQFHQGRSQRNGEQGQHGAGAGAAQQRHECGKQQGGH